MNTIDYMPHDPDNDKETSVITVRIPQEMQTRLDRLAHTTRRSRNFHAVEAIAEYIALNEWQIERIKEGISDADAGRTVPHAKVKEWARSLRNRKPLRRPKA
ncbi:MAG: CopG family ribbon-helix-helix protein [Alphaproteobacteria bacterium]|nr:CopG family ribbon-helix-helix protein [Alphaproteobacteria bacterium]